MLVLNGEDVRRALPMAEAIAGMKRAFAALSEGRVVMPHRAHLGIERHGGVSLVMPAYVDIESGEALAVKVVSLFDHNAARGIPRIQAAVVAFEPETGRPLALLEGATLTAIRTGAASGAATDLLARPDSRVAAIFGAGVQARKQVEAIHLVRPLETVWVIDPADDVRDRFAKEMEDELEITVIPTGDAEAAVRAADILATASSSPTPVFDGAWLKPGTHINNIGSHSPGARELDTETVKRSYYVADLKEANLAEAGDILIPIEEGAVTADHIAASLGEVVIGEKPGRPDDERITLFKSCGLAIQDVSSATAVYRAALEKGAGTEIALN